MAPKHPLSTWLGKNTRLWRSFLSLGLLLGVWQIFGMTGRIEPFNFSWPSVIFHNMVELAKAGTLGPNLAYSGLEYAMGFGIALLAIPLGLVIGYSRTLDTALRPYIMAFYATPMIALAPLFMIWFNFGIGSKVVVITAMSLFPILMNTIAGVKNANGSLLRAAKSFGASEFHIFRTVLLPSSLPYILAGIRIGIGRGATGLVIAEMMNATRGIGYQIQMSAQYFKTAEYLAGVAILLILSVILTEFVRLLEHRVVPWQRSR